MEIRILQLISGAKKAEGLTVIIDVFRAFSTACYVFNNGAEKIIPVGKLETAYGLKEKNTDFILMGEREGKILPGFDFGNSPTLIREVDFTGKSVIQTTSAGTQGIVNAKNASQIITGSFVNATAVVDYILKEKPTVVSLVCMGNAGVEPAAEDIACACYIESLINRARKVDYDNEVRHNRDSNNIDKEKTVKDRKDKKDRAKANIDKKEDQVSAFRQYFSQQKEVHQNEIAEKLKESGQRFFDPANAEWSPPTDFDLCLNFNIFNFILKAERYEEGLFYLKKIYL